MHMLFSASADDQVGTAQFTLLFIQGDKGSPFGHGSDDYFLSGDLDPHQRHAGVVRIRKAQNW